MMAFLSWGTETKRFGIGVGQVMSTMSLSWARYSQTGIFENSFIGSTLDFPKSRTSQILSTASRPPVARNLASGENHITHVGSCENFRTCPNLKVFRKGGTGSAFFFFLQHFTDTSGCCSSSFGILNWNLDSVWASDLNVNDNWSRFWMSSDWPGILRDWEYMYELGAVESWGCFDSSIVASSTLIKGLDNLLETEESYSPDLDPSLDNRSILLMLSISSIDLNESRRKSELNLEDS